MQVSYRQYNDQLNYLHQLVQNSLRMRSMIKSWCITIWSAIAVITLTQWNDSIVPNHLLFGVLLAPVIFFWIADSVERAREYLHKKQIMDIEKDIVSGKDNIESANELFVMSVYDKFTKRKKFEYCIKSSIGGETILSFYPILITISAIAIYLIPYLVKIISELSV